MDEHFIECMIDIDLTKYDYKFYLDHVIDGRALFPATGYLFVVWQEFARLLSTSWDQLPVIFEDIKILRKTVIQEQPIATFKLKISEVSGHFQLYNSDALAFSGRICQPKVGETFLPLQQHLSKADTDQCDFKLQKDVSATFIRRGSE